MLNTLGELSQFCEGLDCLGVKDALNEHTDLMRSFFCTDSKQLLEGTVGLIIIIVILVQCYRPSLLAIVI